MNRLEETTNELLHAGYTIEEIKEAFDEAFNKAIQSKTKEETDN